MLDAIVRQAERTGGLREQCGQLVWRRPRDALDTIGDASGSCGGKHGVERVRRLAARMPPAEDPQARVRVLAREQRKRLDGGRAVEPRPQAAVPEHERRRRVAGGRWRRRAHRRQEHGRRRALGGNAPERREHPDDVGALRLVRDEQEIGAIERREHVPPEPAKRSSPGRSSARSTSAGA